MQLIETKMPAWKQKLAWFVVNKMNLKPKTEKMSKLAWHMNFSNSHSLGMWQFLVVYILEFELFWLTIYKINKLTIPKSGLFWTVI